MATDIETRGKRMARIWILIAVTYLVAGATVGGIMGASMNFTFAPVHAHLNLLGWASMALAGLIYDRFPQAGGSRLGVAHFWLHNTVLPALMVVLFLFLGGNQALGPVLGLFSVLMLLTLVVFAVNLYRNIERPA